MYALACAMACIARFCACSAVVRSQTTIGVVDVDGLLAGRALPRALQGHQTRRQFLGLSLQ